MNRKQQKAMWAKNKPKFIVGFGYNYEKGHRVQMNIEGKPISQYDTGTIIGFHKGEAPYWFDVKNDRTGKIELFHKSDLTPEPLRKH